MKYLFKSLFAQDILAYVDLRCSLGNKEDTFGRRLHIFDEFCMENYPDTLLLTQELAESWCTLRPDEKENTLNLRTNILRGFAKYLNSIGKSAYIIPDGFAGKSVPYMPYLYTATELKDFFMPQIIYLHTHFHHTGNILLLYYFEPCIAVDCVRRKGDC